MNFLPAHFCGHPGAGPPEKILAIRNVTSPILNEPLQSAFPDSAGWQSGPPEKMRVIIYVTSAILIAREPSRSPARPVGDDYRPITPKEIAEISAYELKIESWSGKQKQEEGDFPGAFLYPQFYGS